MTTYYVDYEGSAGTGDGSSFANRAGRVADIFPNSSSTRASAGDVIRIKQSPNPTVLGSCKVDKAPAHSSYSAYSRSYSSSVVYSTTTGETKIKLSAGYKTGDRIHVWDNSTTRSGAKAAGKNISGVWSITEVSNESDWFKLDGFTATNSDTEGSGSFRFKPMTAETIKFNGTPPWKNIASHACMRDAWTASSGVTTTHEVYWSDWNATHKWIHPNGSDNIEVPSGGSTGLQAYYELPDTLDLSGYQQISFRVRYYGATRDSASPLTLELCTDTAGATSVHSIPFTPYYCWSDGWNVVVKDFGANLNSAIKSVAIYCSDTSSNEKVYISNIIACKASSSADSITHASLVGLNTADDPVWYPVQSLDERGHISVCYDNLTRKGQNGHGYYGSIGCFFNTSSATATVYKREPILPKYVKDYNLSSSSTKMEDLTWVNDAYSESNFTTASSGGLVSGGWNSTDMSTQVGHTFIRGNGRGYGVYSGNTNVQLEKLHITAFYRGFDFHGEGIYLDDVGASDCYYAGIAISSCKNTRKINAKYAFGSYAGTSSRDTFDIRGQANQNFTHSSATAADFNILWANGANSQNRYAVYFEQCENMLWNKVNVLFAYRAIDFNQGNKGCTFEEWRHGGSTQTYSVKFEDGGNGNNVNNRIKLIKNEANYCGLMIVNCGSGNSCDDLQSKTGEHWGWCVNPSELSGGGTDNPNYRFGRSYWSQAGAIRFGENSCTFTLNGGHSDTSLYIQKSNTLRTDNFEFASSMYSSPRYYIFQGGTVLAKNYDGTSGEILNLFDSQTKKVTPQTAIRKTSSGYALKLEGAYNEQTNFDVAKIIVASGSQVTISAWAYREHDLTNYGLYGKLVVQANSEIGLTSDVVDTIPSGSSNTQVWKQLQCQFTPTASGVVTVQLQRSCDSGSSHRDGYVVFDDLSVSQA